MAQVVHLPGGEGYVNDGERRVVEALAAELPDSVTIYPNVQMVTREYVDDVDALVVTPDVIMAVEIKDLAGDVYIDEQNIVVDGEVRSQPYLLTNAKARRIKGKINSDPSIQHANVWALVVLARKPRTLRVVESMKHRVVSIETAIRRLTPPSPDVAVPGSLTGQSGSIARALRLQPRENVRKIGQYRTDRTIERSANEEVYEAHHELTKERVRLRKLIFAPGTPKAEIEVRRRAALRSFEIAARVDDSAHLTEPGEIFQLDDGSVVITSPVNELVTLEEWATGTAVPIGVRQQIVRNVAHAVATLHRAGIIHGRISPSAVRITPAGNAKLGLLGSARLPDSSGRTVIATELDPFFSAPEVLDPSAISEAVDLYSLGKLIDWLWPSEDDGDGPVHQGSAPPALAEAAVTLTTLEPGERAPTAAALSLVALPGSSSDTIESRAGLKPGAVIDSFELVEIIPGAPDNVWLARDLVTDLDCVVKFFNGESGLESARNQFQLLRNLTDPGLVRVRHVGAQTDGALLVTEYLQGTDLASAILSGRTFSSEESMVLWRGLVAALVTLHSSEGRPAHGDVKPDNLVLSDDGLVLVDFDLSVPPGCDQVGGSPAYLPPDENFDSTRHDRDMYAAGLILHELLTGSRPSDLRSTPVLDPKLPEPLAAFIRKAVHPRRSGRFTSAEVMANEFDLACRALDGWRLGDLVVEPTEQFEMKDVAPMGGGDPIPVVDVHRFRVALPTNAVLHVDVLVGRDGDGWIITSEVENGSPILERLKRGLRMSFTRDEALGTWAELRQARLTPDKGPDWSNLFKASVEELDHGSGLGIVEILDECNAAVGSRAELLGDKGKHRSFICAVFPDETPKGPLTAYLLTRVLPLLRGVGGPETHTSGV